jgi:hypothetical protein
MSVRPSNSSLFMGIPQPENLEIRNKHKETDNSKLLDCTTRKMWLRPETHYPHVTWAHVMLRVRLECERRFNIEFYGADSHFCHSPHVTWSRVELWLAHMSARLSHFCCRTRATAEMWEACWHVCQPELHVRSRDVRRVTEVWIWAIEFNVKSPFTFQPHA